MRALSSWMTPEAADTVLVLPDGVHVDVLA